MPHNWYSITDIDHLDTPALVIYPDRVQHNINLLKGMIDDVARLRVHVKTHKAVEPTRLLMTAGINKFKCATIAEAEMLGQCAAPDVLLAYQPTGPKLNRFIDVIKHYPATKYACLIDNESIAHQLSVAALGAGIVINVYADLNVGMNRTGILPNEDAFQLYLYASNLQGINVVGLHAYDGHIHDSNLSIRTIRCNLAFEPVEQFKNQIIENGLPEPIIVAGGSPTFPVHAQRRGVECSPGTFIYWDWGYTQQLPEQAFLPAVLLVSRVVSIPTPDTICLDAGHKSIASESSLNKRIHFLNAPDLHITGHSEEHMIASTGGDNTFKVGDVLYGIPYHVCPTVALYERAITIENGCVANEWKTIARDRKITL